MDDGFWLLSNLKSKSQEHPPVIILSGNPMLAEGDVLNAGAVAFLTKPYNIEDLLQTMRKWLGDFLPNSCIGSGLSMARLF